MSKKRRTYTAEFKQEAVKLVTDQGYTLAAAARSLGIHENLLRNWKQKREMEQGSGSPAGEVSLVEENRRMRAENKRLLLERDILKKATAYFAKESQ
jgi:transposase